MKNGIICGQAYFIFEILSLDASSMFEKFLQSNYGDKT